jgi:hypothetical protein
MKIYLEEDKKKKYRTHFLEATANRYFFLKKKLNPLFVAVGLRGFTL